MGLLPAGASPAKAGGSQCPHTLNPLHLPLPLAGASTGMKRGFQHMIIQHMIIQHMTIQWICGGLARRGTLALAGRARRASSSG